MASKNTKTIAGFVILGAIILGSSGGSSKSTPSVTTNPPAIVAEKEVVKTLEPMPTPVAVAPTPVPEPEPVTQPEPVPTPPPAQAATNSCQYSCSGPDKDCSDFSSHAQAQQFFDCCGFSAGYDPMRLDSSRGVGNGLACESL